jgi:predicted AAA+ superfamily ATPase
MPMYQRCLNLQELLNKRSYFLFGPRATGKSTLIRTSLPDARVYDLLNADTYRRLLSQPSIIEQETTADQTVVIDEIQKLPGLLDEVHRLIEIRKQRFLLTGSSARKLRHGSANLLAGRAYQAELFPLIHKEIDQFDLVSYLNTTGLPEFYGDNLARDFLKAYVGTYLREEVQAESLVRNLAGFSRFLDVVALSNGEEISYASLASDCGVAPRTLEGYFSILDDTLIGFRVPPYLNTVKRKAITRAKYWLFDCGVVNSLTRRGYIESGSELFGRAFEHFIALELRAFLSYKNSPHPLQYWRSTSQFEVDFIVGQEFALEVKATTQVSEKHLKGLRALAEEGQIKHLGVISQDSHYRLTQDGIHIWPWAIFLDQLWAGTIGQRPSE